MLKDTRQEAVARVWNRRRYCFGAYADDRDGLLADRAELEVCGAPVTKALWLYQLRWNLL